MSQPLRKPSPSVAPPGPAEAGGVRARIGLWLRALTDVGERMGRAIGVMGRREDDAHCVEQSILERALSLVMEAMHWTDALRLRLLREARAARAARPRPEAPPSAEQHGPPMDPGTRAMARAARRWDPAQLRKLGRSMERQHPNPAPDACILGIPTAAVMARICADLHAAATLIDDQESARRIMEIAEAARALLSGPAPMSPAGAETDDCPIPDAPPDPAATPIGMDDTGLRDTG
jgi:hypothetical protein